jgi:hypothetical protein
MLKIYIILEWGKGVKPFEGEKGQGGSGTRNPRGERGRAAARRRSSEYGWNIVTGYEEIKKPWIAWILLIKKASLLIKQFCKGPLLLCR